jgi:siderophore synthetase component
MGSLMNDVTATAEPVVDIWPYVEELVHEDLVSAYVFENCLVEKCYRNDAGSYEHVLLPTGDLNIFMVLIIQLSTESIFGHYLLDLEALYSTGAEKK